MSVKITLLCGCDEIKFAGCTKCNTSQAYFSLEQKLRVARAALENIQKHCKTLTNEYQRLGAYAIATRALDQTK